MKTESNIIHYASRDDYLNRKPTAVKDLVSAKAPNPKLEKAADLGTGDTKNLSEAKEDIKSKVKDKVSETKEAGKHLLNQAGSALVRTVGSGLLNTVGITPPSVTLSPTSLDIQEKKVKTMEGDTLTRVNKPGIFFIKGFDINPFSNNEEGLTGMSKNIPTSQVFNWNDSDEILNAVRSRPHSQPIILVGHGMGGDTAVDIVNQLNSVEHGFRRIDLLVTMDSIGTDNDIIPQNVKENFNLISDQDSLINDGPNVARKKNQTLVDNHLLELGHNEMEVDPEVQFLVYDKINQTLMDAVSLKNFRSGLNQNLLESHRLGAHSLSFI